MIAPELFVSISEYLDISDLRSVSFLTKDVRQLFTVISLTETIWEYECVKHSDNIFVEACSRGFLHLVRYICEHDKDLKKGKKKLSKVLQFRIGGRIIALSKIGDAAFISATIKGHLNIIEYLHKFGIKLSIYKKTLSMSACDNGHLDIVKYLHPIYGSAKSYEQLLRVCELGYLDIAKYLVENGARISVRTIELASNNGYLDIVKYLHQRRIRPYNNGRVIQAAVKGGKLDVVEYLLDVAPDLAIDYDDLLIIAYKHDHINIIDHLCDIGADPDKCLLVNDDYVSRYVDTIDCLYKNGADLSTKNNMLLRTACQFGYLHIVRYLHENGIDLSASNNVAIKTACIHDNLDIIKYLCENGVDPRVDAPIRLTRNLDIIKYLHQLGADLSAENDAPIRNAISEGKTDIVKYLHENGANPFTNLKAIKRAYDSGYMDTIEYLYSNEPPSVVMDYLLEEASKNGNIILLRDLHKHGADLTKNSNVIKNSCMNGNLAMVKYLHRNGASVNGLVEVACTNGHLDIVKYLHKCGENMTEGGSIRMAVMKKHYDVVGYLYSHGAKLD